jgi:hypothetical protein
MILAMVIGMVVLDPVWRLVLPRPRTGSTFWRS